MTTTYRTIVTELPPTPLGLLTARWHIEHRCTTCHHAVPGDQFIAHARDHHSDGSMNQEGHPAIPRNPPGGENR